MTPLSPPASNFHKKLLEDALRLLELALSLFPIGQILNTRWQTSLEGAPAAGTPGKGGRGARAP